MMKGKTNHYIKTSPPCVLPRLGEAQLLEGGGEVALLKV